MSGGIRQMQIRFNAEEDRLLFALNTSDYAEFRFWLTRRYVKMLWPVLQRALERSHQEVVQISDPLHKQAMLSFRHDEAVAGADFKTPYQAGPQAVYPLGDAPILATKAGLKPDEGKTDLYLFSLHPQEGRGVDIKMDTKLLHAFCKLLTEALANSGWDLPFRLSSTLEVPKEKRVIN